MKQHQKITLTRLKHALQERMNYDNPDLAFEVLIYGWCKNRKHRTNWLSDVKRRGWISLSMAHDFENYCGYLFI